MGIGIMFLFYCDFVYVILDIWFVLLFINLGFVFEYVLSYFLFKVVGYIKVVEWLMLGEFFIFVDVY